MKTIKTLLAIGFIFALVACTGTQEGWDHFGWKTVECTVYADIGATPENSLIAKRIANPCQAQRFLGTAAKLGVVWDAYKVDEFNLWADTAAEYIGSGITYNDLVLFVEAEIAKFNQKAGGTMIILSDLLVQFPDTTLIMEKDQILALMSLDDLRSQVAKLGLIYK